MIECKLNVIFAERRIKKGEFAKRIGKNAGTLSSWVSGKSLPNLDDAYAVAEELDLNVMQIWVLSKKIGANTPADGECT